MKFSIRDLLLVTVIVALAVGWWIDHRVQVSRLRTVGVFLSEFASEYGRQIWVYDRGEIMESVGKDIVPASPASQAHASKPPKE